MPSRHFIDLLPNVPAHKAVVYSRGAVLNGAITAATSATVFSGHEISAGDKFLFSPTIRHTAMTTVYTVSAADATSVTFSPALTAPDKALLVGLGTDTGGAQRSDGSYEPPNYDGSSQTIYEVDDTGSDAITNAVISTEPGGEIGWYSTTSPVWVVLYDTGKNVSRVYVDMFGQDTSSSFNLNAVTGITASTTQSQGEQALTAGLNEVATVSNANDVVTLPAAVQGRRCIVINNGANILQVYPNSGDDLGEGADSSTIIFPSTYLLFRSYDSTKWIS